MYGFVSYCTAAKERAIMLREEIVMNSWSFTREQLCTMIKTLLNRYHAEAAILFGSYARQEADDVSDIDVMIIGGSDFEPTDVFSLADDLHRMTRKDVDVFELCEIDQQSDFYKTIMREGVRIAA